MELAKLFVSLAADTSDFKKGMADAASSLASTMSPVAEGARHAAAGLDLVSASAAGIGSAAGSASGGVSGLGMALANMAGNIAADVLERTAHAIVDVGRESLQLAGELEQSKIAFTTLLGSGQKADAFLRDLTTFAANTPFELKGLQESSKKLLAFGFDARDIIPIMRSVGDATAALGGGKQMIDGITLAIGQMSAKGKVSAEEMNQLAERGVPAWKLVADAIGKDIPTAMKMAEKGAIDSSTAINALVTGMESKFGGLMEKQSKTFLGAMSNLGDGTEQVLTRIGQKVLQALPLTEIVSTAGTAMSRLADIIEKEPIPSFAKLSDIMKGVFADPTIEAGILGIGVAMSAAIAPAAIEAGAALVAMGVAGVGAFISMSAAAFPYVALAAAVAFAAKPIIENWSELPGAFGYFFGQIESTVLSWYQGLRNVAKQAQDAFHAVAANISNFFKPVFDWLGNAFQKAVDLLPDSAKGAANSLAQLFQGAKASVGGAIESIPGMVSATLSPVAGSIGSTARSWASNATSGMQSVADGISGAFSSVGSLWNKLTADSSKAMDALGKNSQLHLAKANKALDDHAKAHKKAADAAAKAAKQISDAYKKEAADLQELDMKAALSGWADPMEYLKQKAGILENALKSLHEKGVGPADARFRQLQETLKGVYHDIADIKEVETAVKQFEKLDQTMNEHRLSMVEIDKQSQVFGNSFDAAGAKADDLKTTMKKLLKDGMQPLDPQMQHLNQAFQEWSEQSVMDGVARDIETVNARVALLGPSVDVAKESAGIYSSALAKLATQHVTTGANVETLKDRLAAATIQTGNSSAANLTLEQSNEAVAVTFAKIDAMARILGPTYDAHAEKVKNLRDALKDAAEKAQGEFTPAVEAARNRMLAAMNAEEMLTDTTTASRRAFSDLSGGISATGKALGMDFNDPLSGTALRMLDFQNGMAQTIVGIQNIGPALTALGQGFDTVIIPAVSGAAQALSGDLGGALSGVAGFMADAIETGGTLGTVLAVLTNPITLIGGAIVAVVGAGVALINNWDTIKSVALGFFQSIADWAGKSMQFVINNVHDAWERILNFFTGGVHKMDLWVDAAKEQEFQTQKVTKALVEQIEFVDKLGASMMQALGNGGIAMKAFLDGSKGMAASLRDNVRDAIIGGIVDAMARQHVIENVFGGMFDDLGRAMANGNTSLATNLIQQIGAMVPQVASSLEGMLGPLKQALSDAFSGGATAIDDIRDATSKAMQAQDFAASIGGKDDGLGTASDLTARANILKKALTDLNEAGEAGSSVFQDYKAQLDQVAVALDKAKAAAKDDKADTKAMDSLADAAYGSKIGALQGQLAKLLDNGKGPGSADYDAIYSQITQAQADLAAAKAGTTPKLATGGLATGPTMAMIGEGADHEAVLPLNAGVYSQMAQGIVKALPAPAPGGGRSGDSYTLVVQYTGKGRWTKQDATELGDLLVGQIRQKLGVRL